MNRTVLIAIIVGAAAFLGVQYFVKKPKPLHVSRSGVAVTESAYTIRPRGPEGDRLDLGAGASLVTNGWSGNSHGIELTQLTHTQEPLLFAVELEKYAYLSTIKGQWVEKNGEVIWSYEDKDVKLTRRVKTSDRLYSEWVVTAEFKTDRPKMAFLSLIAKQDPEGEHEADRKLSFWDSQKTHRFLLKDNPDVEVFEKGTTWASIENRYFVLSLIPTNKAKLPKAIVQTQPEGGPRLNLGFPIEDGKIEIPFKLYFGSKTLETLKQIEPSLDLVVDFGFFTWFAYPLLRVMKFFYKFTHNYGIAIILLTILVRLLLFPLTYKSIVSMKEMAKIQPHIKKIQEKYKDDKERLNREMLTLMKTHGYNPLAGCLPILAQMPVFFALYQVLYSSVELYHAPFGLWIFDLSAKDPYFVLPVLVSAAWWLQQKITPSTISDPNQKMIMQLTPIIFGVFMISSPSGLGIYFFMNASLAILQQWLMNKKFGSASAPIAAAGL